MNAVKDACPAGRRLTVKLRVLNSLIISVSSALHDRGHPISWNYGNLQEQHLGKALLCKLG